jgi:dTDP-4-dehydrorhamnose reductase
MRVTLFGASGLLGQELVRELQGEQLTALSSKDADLRDRARVQSVIRDSRPDCIILSAAYTDVDGCESNRDLAFAVNCDGAAIVAKAAREAGSRLIFLSTDYVFDGEKRSPYEINDPRNPTSVYGESKARAEERLQEILPDVCIARTSWLFGHGGKCFPATILKLAATRPEISVVNDQRGSPTFTRDLASAIAKLCSADAKGIVHVTNSGNCTWYDFAAEIVRASGLPTRVKPVTTAEFPRPARRPACSVLSPDSLHAYNIHMPTWEDALARYLNGVPAVESRRERENLSSKSSTVARSFTSGRASRGSRRQLQDYVNKHEAVLTGALMEAVPNWSRESVANLRWVSPLAKDDYAEYRDADFLNVVGLDDSVAELARFWPSRGPSWDALATVRDPDSGGRAGVILVEAKSHISEIYGNGCQAGPRSRGLIEKALAAAKQWCGANSDADWTGPLYQSANRIAHLYFIRELVKYPAWLVNLYFINDPIDRTDHDTWRAELRKVKASLGLTSTVPFTIDLFLPALEDS